MITHHGDSEAAFVSAAAARGGALLDVGPGRGATDDELQKEVTLLELLDRVLDKGVVLSGEITLAVADVDLVYVGLRVLLSSVEAADRNRQSTTLADDNDSVE
jgi:hypothetical protein